MNSLFPGVAVVTGAASGIGRQVALSFCKEGCTSIAILDQDRNGLADTEKMMKEVRSSSTTQTQIDILALTVDIRSETEVSQAFEEIIKIFERIDYAVNCAGIYGSHLPSHELSINDFDNILSINCRGLWLCARQELRVMMKQNPLRTHDDRPGNRGSIVHIASNLALVSKGGTPAYNASKAAVVSLTRTDAIDYSPHNIRVNCVCPGVIDTPMTAGMPKDDPVVKIAPMGRMGTSQEVADAALFFASPKASFTQGAALAVDGGYTIN